MNSEYCLSKSMRPHPLTLPTVTPLSLLSSCTIRAVCESVQQGWRDSESSYFYTEIVSRRRRKQEGWQPFHGFKLLFSTCLNFSLPSLHSSMLRLQDIPDLVCQLLSLMYPHLSVCPQNDPKDKCWSHPQRAFVVLCISRHTKSQLSDVIMYAATMQPIVTPHDVSQWRCHYCEPADSKMAENQVMVEVKCCASDKWVSTGFICAHICAHVH